MPPYKYVSLITLGDNLSFWWLKIILKICQFLCSWLNSNFNAYFSGICMNEQINRILIFGISAQINISQFIYKLPLRQLVSEWSCRLKGNNVLITFMSVRWNSRFARWLMTDSNRWWSNWQRWWLQL